MIETNIKPNLDPEDERRLEKADRRVIKLGKHKPRLIQRLEYGNKASINNPFGNVLMDIGMVPH